MNVTEPSANPEIERHGEENKNRSHRLPFSEYKSISIHQLDSSEFREKYGTVFFVDGRMVPNDSEIIVELAKKMNKTQKATHLAVKRKFPKASSNDINPQNENESSFECGEENDCEKSEKADKN